MNACGNCWEPWEAVVAFSVTDSLISHVQLSLGRCGDVVMGIGWHFLRNPAACFEQWMAINSFHMLAEINNNNNYYYYYVQFIETSVCKPITKFGHPKSVNNSSHSLKKTITILHQCHISYGIYPCISRPPILEPKNKFFLFLCKNFLETISFILELPFMYAMVTWKKSQQTWT